MMEAKITLYPTLVVAVAARNSSLGKDFFNYGLMKRLLFVRGKKPRILVASGE